MHTEAINPFNKVPALTVAFWIIKILSTTVGETGADFLAVNAGWGLMVTTGFMLILLSFSLLMEMRAQHYTPWSYWLTVVLISIVGTQITDVFTDEFGVSLYISTAIFSTTLAIVFLLWFHFENTLSIYTITTRRRECFYWCAILFTFALGTAAGDLATEELALGFKWGVVVFGSLIAVTTLAWKSGLNRVLAFWIAYILTRPLGASIGDLLTQSKTYGGLGLSTMITSVCFLLVIVTLVSIAQYHISKSARSSTIE